MIMISQQPSTKKKTPTQTHQDRRQVQNNKNYEYPTELNFEYMPRCPEQPEAYNFTNI